MTTPTTPWPHRVRLAPKLGVPTGTRPEWTLLAVRSVAVASLLTGLVQIGLRDFGLWSPTAVWPWLWNAYALMPVAAVVLCRSHRRPAEFRSLTGLSSGILLIATGLQAAGDPTFLPGVVLSVLGLVGAVTMSPDVLPMVFPPAKPMKRVDTGSYPPDPPRTADTCTGPDDLIADESDLYQFDYQFESDLDVWCTGYPDLVYPEEWTIDDWAAENARLYWDDDDEPSDDEVERLKRLLISVGDSRHLPDGTWSAKFVHVADPRDTPVAVTWVRRFAEGDRETTLRSLVHADSPDLLQPARVDHLPTPAGIALRGRTLARSTEPGEQTVIATVAYAWRLTESGGCEIDLVLRASGGDLDRMSRLDLDLQGLARTLSRYEPDTGDGDGDG